MKHVPLPLYTIVIFGDNSVAAMNMNNGRIHERYAFVAQQPNCNGQTIGSFQAAHDAASRDVQRFTAQATNN